MNALSAVVVGFSPLWLTASKVISVVTTASDVTVNVASPALSVVLFARRSFVEVKLTRSSLVSARTSTPSIRVPF